MNRFVTYSKTLFALTLLLFATSHLYSQRLTETLQKQVWPTASPLSMDAWETLLPALGTDTVVDPSATTAEVVILDLLGRPQQVTQLQRTDGRWEAQSTLRADFDGTGRVVRTQTWKRENGQWEYESMIVRKLNQQGEETSFEFRVWEDGGWKTHYRQTNFQAGENLSAKLIP